MGPRSLLEPPHMACCLTLLLQSNFLALNTSSLLCYSIPKAQLHRMLFPPLVASPLCSIGIAIQSLSLKKVIGSPEVFFLFAPLVQQAAGKNM